MENSIEIGVSLPEVLPPGTALPDVAGLARVAEQAGLDGVWAADRLVNGDLSTLDPALTLAAAAAVTTRVAIGFAVLVPSLRPLVWTAKQVATLRHLAGDRLRLGVAAGGGSAGEYQLAGFDPAARVRRTEDFLRLLPDLLGGLAHPGPGPARRARGPAPAGHAGAAGMGRRGVRGRAAAGRALRRRLAVGPAAAGGVRGQPPPAVRAGRPGRPARPRTGVGLHVALGPRPGPELKRATVTALQTAYGLATDRAEQVAVAGTPAQVAEQLDRYVAEGADLIVVVCDPEPTPRSWELLAEARRLVRRAVRPARLTGGRAENPWSARSGCVSLPGWHTSRRRTSITTSRMGGCCWLTSRSGSVTARRWPWSGRTARARPRCCA